MFGLQCVSLVFASISYFKEKRNLSKEIIICQSQLIHSLSSCAGVLIIRACVHVCVRALTSSPGRGSPGR